MPFLVEWSKDGERGGQMRRWTVWVQRGTDGEGQNAVKEAGGGWSRGWLWRPLASGRNV